MWINATGKIGDTPNVEIRKSILAQITSLSYWQRLENLDYLKSIEIVNDLDGSSWSQVKWTNNLFCYKNYIEKK